MQLCAFLPPQLAEAQFTESWTNPRHGTCQICDLSLPIRSCPTPFFIHPSENRALSLATRQCHCCDLQWRCDGRSAHRVRFLCFASATDVTLESRANERHDPDGGTQGTLWQSARPIVCETRCVLEVRLCRVSTLALAQGRQGFSWEVSSGERGLTPRVYRSKTTYGDMLSSRKGGLGGVPPFSLRHQEEAHSK